MSLMRYRIFNLANRANASPRTIQQARQQAQQKRIRETKQPEYTLADLLEDLSNLSDQNFQILISQMNYNEKQHLLEAFNEFENFVTTLVESNYVDSPQLEMIVEARLPPEQQLQNLVIQQTNLKDALVKLNNQLKGATDSDKPYILDKINRNEQRLENVENRIKNLQSRGLTVADVAKVASSAKPEPKPEPKPELEPKLEPTLFDTGGSEKTKEEPGLPSALDVAKQRAAAPAPAPAPVTPIDQKLANAKKVLDQMKSALRSGTGSIEISNVDRKQAGLGAAGTSVSEFETARRTPTEPETKKPTEPETTKPTKPETTKPTEPETTKTTPEPSPETAKSDKPETRPEYDPLTVGNIVKKFGSKHRVAHYLNRFLNVIDNDPRYSRIKALFKGIDYQPREKFRRSKAGFRDFPSTTPPEENAQHYESKLKEYQQIIKELQNRIKNAQEDELPELMADMKKFEDKAANVKFQLSKLNTKPESKSEPKPESKPESKSESKYFDNNKLQLVECLKNMNETQTKAYYNTLNAKEQIILEQILCEYVTSRGNV